MNKLLKIKKLGGGLQWTINTIDDVFFAKEVYEIFERIKDARITNIIDGYFWHNCYITKQNLNNSDTGLVETNIYCEGDYR